MAPLAAFPWAWLLAGLLLGSWIGATIGSAAVLLLAGRRMKRLETVNQLLRIKLRAQQAALLAGGAARAAAGAAALQSGEGNRHHPHRPHRQRKLSERASLNRASGALPLQG